MFRILLGYLMKMGVVAAPVLLPFFVRFGADSLDEKKAGALISCALLTVVFGFDIVDHALPRLHAEKFRAAYLREVVNKHFEGSAEHLRFNLMLARRRWFVLWLFRVFHWSASIGFDRGRHHDARLCLAEWQGVCGQALRAERPVFTDFRGLPKTEPHWRPWKNPSWLFRWQAIRTRDVLVICSIPLLVERGTPGNPIFRAVGVLNIDAVSGEGADWLKANWRELASPMMDLGGLLAVL